jgi:hypothetical protein
LIVVCTRAPRAVLTLAEADAELQRLTLLKKNHVDEQYVARRQLRDLPRTIANLSARLASLTSDDETAKAHAAGPITIDGETYAPEDAAGILARQCHDLAVRGALGLSPILRVFVGGLLMIQKTSRGALRYEKPTKLFDAGNN